MTTRRLAGELREACPVCQGHQLGGRRSAWRGNEEHWQGDKQHPQLCRWLKIAEGIDSEL
uniref:Uncharacterized protein n=1 Tax=Oryza sativa subsp. japonica TaxID=39947 RepID=Q6ZBJ0_ORYSJ|nr:hypothetical protein [Oryza sativa Japonica Group]BAD09718.1 hypothetical protein [Oryza sativa Japonica Group]